MQPQLADLDEDDIVAQTREAIAKRLERVAEIHEIVEQAGLRFVTYEGGQHLKENSDVFCANPAVYEVHQHYLGELEKHFGLFMHYTHNGSHSSGNSWGAKDP